MKANRSWLLWRRLRAVVLLASLLSWPWLQTRAATNVIIWDTGARFDQTIELKDRDGWRAVPTDITALEVDPGKAASDPGYYGRTYTFQGDAVVENAQVTAVFQANQGKISLFSHRLSGAAHGAESDMSGEAPAAELLLMKQSVPAARITQYAVRRNANDEVILEITASVPSSKQITAQFSFGRSGAIGVKPGREVTGIRVLSPTEYGVAPAFIGDDLVVSAADAEDGKPLSLPADDLFVGLLKGENQMLVMTWPTGSQTVQLGFGSDPGHGLASLDFRNDGKSVYLTLLQAPGIWHKESLSASYLEKDTPSSWRRPFPANWKTVLSEAGVKTTFSFRESKGQIWRGVPGSYIYPVWFDGNQAVYHFSKKIPPEGESLVYFLEANHTPASVLTPADMLQLTLGMDTADAILDPLGRQLRTHHRRAGAGVHRACTCGCTEAIQSVFESGNEVEQKEYVDGALRDMVFFVEQHVGRIEEYQKFARDLLQYLKTQETGAPELKAYAESVADIARQMLQEYDAQKDNMKSLGYAQELVNKTLRLTEKKEQGNLEAYMQLLKDWRAMGGAQDYVLAECHVLGRKLFQEAGSGAIHEPRALPMAKEIRTRCRQVLRNPDGYEIWANY